MTFAQAYIIIVGTVLATLGILCLIILLKREWKKRKSIRALQKAIDSVKNIRLHIDFQAIDAAMKQIDEIELRLKKLIAKDK